MSVCVYVCVWNCRRWEAGVEFFRWSVSQVAESEQRDVGVDDDADNDVLSKVK